MGEKASLMHVLLESREVDFSNNQLTSLPESLGGLKSLESLGVWFHKASRVSSGPKSWPGEAFFLLRRLLLYSNELRQVPDTLGDLQSLERLIEMPRWMCCVATVRHLDVNGNQLQRLPETIGQLLSLKHLASRAVGSSGATEGPAGGEEPAHAPAGRLRGAKEPGAPCLESLRRAEWLA